MGYRKGYSSQHSLIAIFEKWKKNLDKGGECGALFVDLSKAFDCLQHDLLLAKLNAYGFDYKSLKLISSFLSNRKYRTKINSSFSEWKHLLIGIPQGSVLGLLSFNIYICDLFLFMSESNVANYADDKTLYACEKKLYDVKIKFESESLILFEWFHDNYLKANSGKSYVMLTIDSKLKINVKSSPISNKKMVKLLGESVDSKLSFEPGLNLVCKKVSQKLHAFARVSKFISKEKLKVVMKAFIMSQFSYCPLVWMCHSRTLNNKINKLHERALRLVYDDRQSTFEELLNTDKSVTIHHRNLQVLATELYKVHHILTPELMKDIFKKRNVTYSFRKNSTFEIRNIKSVYYGSETISFIGPKILELLPSKIKDSEKD